MFHKSQVTLCGYLSVQRLYPYPRFHFKANQQITFFSSIQEIILVSGIINSFPVFSSGKKYFLTATLRTRIVAIHSLYIYIYINVSHINTTDCSLSKTYYCSIVESQMYSHLFFHVSIIFQQQ